MVSYSTSSYLLLALALSQSGLALPPNHGNGIPSPLTPSAIPSGGPGNMAHPSGAPFRTACPTGPIPSGVPAAIVSKIASRCGKQSGAAQSTDHAATVNIFAERAVPSKAHHSIPTFFPTGGPGKIAQHSGGPFPSGCPTGPIPSGVPASTVDKVARRRSKHTRTAVSTNVAAESTRPAVAATSLVKRALPNSVPTGTAHPSVPASASSFLEGLSTATGHPTNLPSGFPASRPSGAPTNRPSGLSKSEPANLPTGAPKSKPANLP